MRIRQLLLWEYVISSVMLVACTALVPSLSSQSGVTLSPTPPTSRTPIPIPPTPTFEPTLPASQEQLMKELLQDKNCKLPCYLDITPGKTTLTEGKAILDSLGASFSGEYQRKTDNGIIYPFTLVIGGQPELDETPMPDGSIVTVYHHVSLITNNDMVQIIEVDAGTAGPGRSTEQAMGKVREFWSRYSAREILPQLGMPEELYIDVIDPTVLVYGRTIFMVYEKHGVVVELYGTRVENNICPDYEARSINLHLTLYNPDSGLSIYSAGRTTQDLGLPINEVLGVNTAEFYKQVLSTPSSCFKPLVKKP